MYQLLYTRPAVLTVLLFILKTILVASSDLTANYKSLGPGYSYGYLQTPPSEQFFSTRSLLDCTVLSLNSQSQFFTYNKVSHVCKNYSPKNIMTVNSTNDNNEISFYEKNAWIKVYTMSVGANSLFYDSLLNRGSPSTWNVDKCNGSYCPNFFRHPLLDIWNRLPLELVKLIIYKNETAVVTMMFDGRNTTLENWFSVNNLKSSPWNDLIPGHPVYFSIAGVDDKRRFFVATDRSGCTTHKGWLMINDKHDGCDWEKLDHIPTILYSNTNSKVVWNDGYGVADSMAIFIQLR